MRRSQYCAASLDVKRAGDFEEQRPGMGDQGGIEGGFVSAESAAVKPEAFFAGRYRSGISGDYRCGGNGVSGNEVSGNEK